MSLYTVVVPVYNSEHTLYNLYDRIKNAFENTIKQDFELILVDDGSKDNSYSEMKKLRELDSRVHIIQLSRNFGQHPALLCGFSYVKGDFVITMDDDLQHPPEELPKMIAVMEECPDIDVILAKYKSRNHGFIRRAGTRLSVYLTTKMLKKDRHLEITSFRLMRRFVVDAIAKMDVRNPQIGNLLVQTSNRIVNVEVLHDARKYGKSGYSFLRLVHDLFHDIVSNSGFPLIIVRNIGFASFFGAGLLALYYVTKYFVFGVSVAGFTTIVLLISGFSGLILLAIGIMGEYLMHILGEAKKMPNYTIRDRRV